jgi:hypothetical protein
MLFTRKNATDPIVANLSELKSDYNRLETATFKSSLTECIGSIDYDYLTVNNSFTSNKADISRYAVDGVYDASDKVGVSTTQENVSGYKIHFNTGVNTEAVSNYGTYYVNNPWSIYAPYWFSLDACSYDEKNEHTEGKYLIDIDYTDVRVICATSRYKRRFFINI